MTSVTMTRDEVRDNPDSLVSWTSIVHIINNKEDKQIIWTYEPRPIIVWESSSIKKRAWVFSVPDHLQWRDVDELIEESKNLFYRKKYEFTQ